MNRSLPLLLALSLAGCQACVTYVPLDENRVQSFQVEITGINPAPPAGKTGDSEKTALPIPLTPIELKVKVTAIDSKGDVAVDFDRPVSFRVTPGNLVGVRLKGSTSNTADMMLPAAGGVAEGSVLVEKVFGGMRLWAMDAPPPPVFSLPTDTGGTGLPDAGPTAVEDGGLERTFAAGLSRVVYFAKPTLADVQRSPLLVPGCTSKCKIDNRQSPFVGNFLTIDAPMPVGDMIVTAVTAEGFYVTDKLAKQLPLPVYQDTVGTFGHMYVYNYSYPDGLSVGDRVLSLTGTVQEFSGDTQMTFPSWVRREGDPRPQDIPDPMLFDFSNESTADPAKRSVGFKLCKINTAYAPKFPSMDQLCGYSNDNIDIESMESALVKIENVKPSTAFADCDTNGNAEIPPFRWMVADGPNGPDFNNASWGCDPGPDQADCTCNKDCVTSGGQYEGVVCSELNTYRNYGQWVVQLEDKWKARINVATRDALPDFDPREFTKPEHAGCTVDITGILRQVQAARPRWLILARTDADVCCRAPADKTCPAKIPVCPKAQQ